MLVCESIVAEVRRNVTSQFGEDGIIAYAFEKAGTINEWCLEVGAHDGLLYSNTKSLRDIGWSAVLIEADDDTVETCKQYESDSVHVVHARVEPIGDNSIDSLLSRSGAPRDPDFMSVDVDGIEFELLSHLAARPRILCVEFAYQSRGKRGVDGIGQWSYQDMLLLAKKMGYSLLVETEVNLILVRNDLVSRFD